jgi:hypothetical protein
MAPLDAVVCSALAAAPHLDEQAWHNGHTGPLDKLLALRQHGGGPLEDATWEAILAALHSPLTAERAFQVLGLTLTDNPACRRQAHARPEVIRAVARPFLSDLAAAGQSLVEEAGRCLLPILRTDCPAEGAAPVLAAAPTIPAALCQLLPQLVLRGRDRLMDCFGCVASLWALVDGDASGGAAAQALQQPGLAAALRRIGGACALEGATGAPDARVYACASAVASVPAVLAARERPVPGHSFTQAQRPAASRARTPRPQTQSTLHLRACHLARFPM